MVKQQTGNEAVFITKKHRSGWAFGYTFLTDEIMNYIGKALAGHAARIGDKNNQKLAAKASKYENPLTDLVALIIAEQKARISIGESLIDDDV